MISIGSLWLAWTVELHLHRSCDKLIFLSLKSQDGKREKVQMLRKKLRKYLYVLKFFWGKIDESRGMEMDLVVCPR